MNARLVACCLLVGVAALAAGCNIVGPIYAVLEGPPDIPAMYELEDRPTVVFVDDRDNVIKLSSMAIRQTLASRVTEDVLEKGGVSTVIDSRDALAHARSHDRHGELLPIDTLGRDVGAEQLIYIEIVRFSESPDGVTPRPTAACRVKVFDVTNRQRLFPDPEDAAASHVVNANLPELDAAILQSRSTQLQVHRQLAEMLGDNVGKLFYKHEAYQIGDRLDPNA